MIFKTVNAKVEKTSYDIVLKNIDLASGHWGSERDIITYLDEIENFLYVKEDFNKKIILHTLKMLKSNIRIKSAEFYRIPEENKLICYVISNVGKFKDFDLFSREMNISFKKEKFSFSIIEMVKEDDDKIKKEGIALPGGWQKDEYLTDRLNKLKEYQ
jgi:hypothetical protein